MKIEESLKLKQGKKKKAQGNSEWLQEVISQPLSDIEPKDLEIIIKYE